MLALSGAMLIVLICFIPAILVLVSHWKVYAKAGQPGWASLIPIYNFYVLLKIVGRPGWWLLLMLVPLVNIVIAVMVIVELAKAFGHGVGFALGLIFLPFIFWLILGFGSAVYIGNGKPTPPPLQ